MSINKKLSKLRHDKAITEEEYQLLKAAIKESEKTYESILVWSDGCETNHVTFTGKTQDEADSAAMVQMRTKIVEHFVENGNVFMQRWIRICVSGQLFLLDR